MIRLIEGKALSWLTSFCAENMEFMIGMYEVA